jgi:hypothetical protein
MIDTDDFIRLHLIKTFSTPKPVKNGLKPYFRPTLEECDCPCDELAQVIRQCWKEDPMERPDFPTYYYPIIVEKICIIIQNIVEKICIIIQSTLLKIIYKNKVVVISSLKA